MTTVRSKPGALWIIGSPLNNPATNSTGPTDTWHHLVLSQNYPLSTYMPPKKWKSSIKRLTVEINPRKTHRQQTLTHNWRCWQKDWHVSAAWHPIRKLHQLEYIAWRTMAHQKPTRKLGSTSSGVKWAKKCSFDKRNSFDIRKENCHRQRKTTKSTKDMQWHLIFSD